MNIHDRETLHREGHPDPLVGKQIGGYRLDRLIASGGMGRVYQGMQMSLDRAVAVKVLPAELADKPELVSRFRREISMLSALNHPHIVSILDGGFGEELGLYYYVMEYVEGVTLREIIEDRTLSASEALALVPPICDALTYAHSQGVIHRDIKPANLLLDRNGHVKIADFGLSRLLEEADGRERITQTHQLMGTLEYMAPEQREGAKKVDHRADIYSLGVVIYEMLTGELPIGRFDPPSRKVQVDVRLDEVVLRVLAKDPERRYQQASDVAVDVKRLSAVDHEPPPPPASYPSPDWAPHPSESQEESIVNSRMSGWAVTSFVLGLLTFVPFIMMILWFSVRQVAR